MRLLLIVSIASCRIHMRSSSSFSLAHTAATNKLSIASWNVNGLRSFLKYDSKGEILNQLIAKRKIDILCLQETKLQESHVVEVSKALKENIGASKMFFSSSTARKGYSGTAIVVLDRGRESINCCNCISYGLGDTVSDAEGRTITLETDLCTIVNVYVPNSGSALKRLDYRVNVWDRKLADHIKTLQTRRSEVPVVLIGDLNVAHTRNDYHNPDEPRTKKQPGTTPEEQFSFQNLFLEELSMKDTFREQYPNRKQYSYYSARIKHLDTGSERRLGMRLDYALLKLPTGSTALPVTAETSIGSIEASGVVSPSIAAASAALSRSRMVDKHLPTYHYDAFIEQVSHPYSDHCLMGLELAKS